MLSPATWYYVHEDGYARIPLHGYGSDNKEAIVDIGSLRTIELVSTVWECGADNGSFPGYAWSPVDGGKCLHWIVATLIPNIDKLPVVDHINRIPLDNRVENLRWVSWYENNKNRGQPFYVLDGKKGASMYRIIYWQEDDCGDWIVQQKYMKAVTHLGRFKCFADAKALAAKTMAELQRLHGDKRAGIKLKPRVV